MTINDALTNVREVSPTQETTPHILPPSYEPLPAELSTYGETILHALKAKKQTLCFAESCTAGMACFGIAAIPGASAILKGSLVAYDEAIKSHLLGVDPRIIAHFGVVSRQTALAMALGAQHLFQTHYSVATTGYAGPTGGDAHATLGTVCFAITSSDGSHSTFLRQFCGSRIEIIQQAVAFVLMKLSKIV